MRMASNRPKTGQLMSTGTAGLEAPQLSQMTQLRRNRSQFVGCGSRTSALFRFANADNASATSSARPLAIP
jgi:hypothetical protein